MNGWLYSDRSPIKALDIPNHRSMHTTPVARTGGIGLLCGIAFGWSIVLPYDSFAELSWLVAGMILIAAVSLWDDIRTLPASVRLLVHLLAAGMLVVGWGNAELTTWEMFLTVLLVVWMLNLFNFMDGMDGLAGSMAVIGFGVLGYAGWLAEDWVFAWSCWVITGAVLGFLRYNLPPAKIFMGDVGSASLGFLVAAFSLHGFSKGLFPLWYPVLAFSPFIVDATVTLIRRALRGEAIWHSHKEHYYQRLVECGLSKRCVLLTELGLMLVAGFSAVFLQQYPAFQFEGLLTWAVLLIVLMVIAEVRYKRFVARYKCQTE